MPKNPENYSFSETKDKLEGERRKKIFISAPKYLYNRLSFIHLIV